MAFYFQHFTLSAGQPDRSGHQAVTGEAVGEHHLPQFPHLENRPNILPSWIKSEDEMTGLQHSVVKSVNRGTGLHTPLTILGQVTELSLFPHL